MRDTQGCLWCACGAEAIGRSGLCRRCRRRRHLSLSSFGGLRERVLARDERRCRACGESEPAQVLVHHRRPGLQRERLLLTLCRSCHVRVHATLRPRYGFPLALRRLWREQHRTLAVQVELPFAAAAGAVSAGEQAVLFAAACASSAKLPYESKA